MTNLPTNPWHKPGAEALHTLLGGDPAADTVLSRVVDQLGLDETAALAGLVRNAVTEAMHAAGLTARQECLLAVATVVAEVHGPDAIYEAFQALEGGEQR